LIFDKKWYQHVYDYYFCFPNINHAMPAQ